MDEHETSECGECQPFRLEAGVSSFHPGGERRLHVGDELMVAADSMTTAPLQAYPGQRLPIPDRELYPTPDRPGEYCSRAEFESAPKYLAQFVHWPARIQAVLEGRYHELRPAHFEGIFTLVCNFMCPHCTRRVTRTRWVEGGTWEHNTAIEKKNTMHPDGLRHALDEAATLLQDGQMGIVWGGGDPTANPYTYDAMLYARERGISASFLTNGVFLDVDGVLEADPILVRISLNCGTEEAYRRFHGYPKGWDYFDRVKEKMREFGRKKLARRSRTLYGISLIMDERNMDDIVAAAEQIRAVVEEVGPAIDYVIVRPVMNYKHFDSATWTKLGSDTKERASALIAPGGAVHGILVEELGIPLVPIKDSFLAPPADDADFYAPEAGGTDCLAYGVCSEIRHNGDVQLCSDSYGNPDFTIGNLFESTLEEIWSGQRRRDVLTTMNERQCFKTYCPHNSRGHHFNRLFHRIERLRAAGRMRDVEQWVTDLREVTFPLGHSFFI